MKKLFAALLILNFLLEAMASAALIFSPVGVLSPGLGEQWSMHYGFAAFTIATIGLWVWPVRHVPEIITATIGILMTFHIATLTSLTVAGDQQGGQILHGILATMAVVLFVLRKRISEETPS